MSNILLGPLISVANNIEYIVTVVVDTSDTLELELSKLTLISEINRIKLRKGQYVQFKFSMSAKSTNEVVHYRISNHKEYLKNKSGVDSWQFEVPSKSITPRIFTCSCNGDGSKLPDHQQADDMYMWKKMCEVHSEYPCHLLIMSGDQIYADTMWQHVQYLKNQTDLIKDKDKLVNFQLGTTRDQLRTELCEFYEQLYFDSWGHSDIAFMLASTPSLMMWDDHDIFDGYGSHDSKVQNSELVRMIYEVASYYFKLFQSRPANINVYLSSKLEHFAQHISYRNYEFFALDGRSQRNQTRVCSNAQYQELKSRLIQGVFNNGKYDNATNPKILCMIIAVPIAHFHYSKFAFGIASVFSGGDFRNDSKDDTLDQWSHTNHRDEQKKLLDIITQASNKNDVRYSCVVSGDVHSAGVAQAYGEKQIQDKRGKLFYPYIAQVVSSPIVHKSQSLLQELILKSISRNKMTIDGCMIQLKNFGGIKKKTIHERNFVVLEKKIKIPDIQRATGLRALLYTKNIPKKDDKNHGYNLPLFIQEKIL